MITEKHNFAIKYVTKKEVELLENVVYESIMDVPFDGVGFELQIERIEYMEQHGLIEYVPTNNMDYEQLLN